MKFTMTFTASANIDLGYFTKYEQQLIVKGIKKYLQVGAHIETRKRKRLRTNIIASWELRLENYRVFYEFEEPDIVKILAIGYKVHNELYIRGKRVEL